MSFIIPFLTYPIPFINKVFDQVKEEESPLFVCNKELKVLADDVLEKKEIRKDIMLIQLVDKESFCSARGTNKYGGAIVTISPNLVKLDPQAGKFFTCHELGHIKNNDLLNIPLAVSIASTTVAVFGAITMPWYTASLLTISVGATVQTLFTNWREGKADDFALENSSDEGLLGARLLFKAMQKVNIESRKDFLSNLLYSPDGESRFDITHPSIASRIKKIENILLEKNIIIIESKDDIEKIEKFAEMLRKERDSTGSGLQITMKSKKL